MTYQVLARKWRPQTFEAVVGQDAITRTLRNALASGRIAHAYLFAGPRGVGKTTTARLLARALLCAERTAAEPCGACAACVEAQAGASVDLLEIDGASNRGIEEIRTLRDNVRYAPARGRFKVYIIDEVHQLTEHAFNALLKTLEEPPAHVVFVLATTDPRDIPATVLSRVQRFDFRPIPPDALAGSLERILGEERVPFDAAALPPIVRAAEGSLRDALSLLDTAIAYGDGRLEADTTASLLGTTAPVEVRAFAAALLGYEVTRALEAVDRAAREGEDLGAFVRDVIELLRRVLVLKAAPTAKLLELTHTEANELRRLGDSVALDEILYILRAFLDADATMRESPHPRVELEIAAVRATRRPVPQALDDILRRVDEAEQRLREQAVGGPAAAPRAQETLLPVSGASEVAAPPSRRVSGTGSTTTAAAPEGGPPTGASASGARPSAPVPAVGTRPSARMAARSADPGTPAAPAEPTNLDAAWNLVVEEVMRKKPMLGAILAQARPVAVEAADLVLALSGNHFHRETLADPAHRELVVQAVRRHLAGVAGFRVTAEGDNGSVTAHPTVQAALVEFQGEVVAVRPRPPGGQGQ
jgi:DNA polymerase III subunit gamma/tau